MGRSAAAILAGAALWSALWIATGASLAALFPDIVVEDRYLGHTGMLSTYLAASVVYSIAAGYLTGVIARSKVVRHGLALGVLQLVLGVGFELSYWALLPAWYHLVFLALLIPGNVFGAWLRANRVAGVAAHA